ncbi:MAG: hypothetical protein E7617_03345 [Ruminococcaceae bacterium]|nr:hypothetical protein [Oscillospiraceae bacterium]
MHEAKKQKEITDMANVIAICTACGKQIAVDPERDAVICPECGQPIITAKAIEKYMLETFGKGQAGKDESDAPEIKSDAPTFDAVYQVEDGELTKYKGNKRELTLPEGIKKIGKGAFDGCDLEHLTLPSSLESVAEDTMPKKVTFPLDSRLTHIEDFAFRKTEIIENFPLGVQGCTRCVDWFTDPGRKIGLILLARATKEEFTEAYKDDPTIEYFSLKTGEHTSRRSRHLFLYEYVETKNIDGWQIAIGKNEAFVIDYTGPHTGRLVMPSEVDGVPVTRCFSIDFTATGELHLSKNLQYIENCKEKFLTSRLTLYIPSSVKEIGCNSIKCHAVYFEKRDGVPYSEVTAVADGKNQAGIYWEEGDETILAPFMKASEDKFVSSHFLGKEDFEKQKEDSARRARYNGECRDVIFICQARNFKSFSIGINSRIDGWYNVNITSHQTTLRIHPEDDVVITKYDSVGIADRKAIGKGFKSCVIKENFLWWSAVITR